VPCRIASCDITDGSFEREDTWPALQDAMISAMIRLEQALAPYIDGFRNGDTPDVSSRS
jgi:hypothetical protein